MFCVDTRELVYTNSDTQEFIQRPEFTFPKSFLLYFSHHFLIILFDFQFFLWSVVPKKHINICPSIVVHTIKFFQKWNGFYVLKCSRFIITIRSILLLLGVDLYKKIKVHWKDIWIYFIWKSELVWIWLLKCTCVCVYVVNIIMFQVLYLAILTHLVNNINNK